MTDDGSMLTFEMLQEAFTRMADDRILYYGIPVIRSVYLEPEEVIMVTDEFANAQEDADAIQDQMAEEYARYGEYLNSMLGIPVSDIDDESVTETIKVMEDWHQALLDGSANDRMPDPNGVRYDEERVDHVIKVVMDFFRRELRANPNYHEGVGMRERGVPMDQVPWFEQLEGAAREAFVQDIKEAAREKTNGTIGINPADASYME